MKVICKEHNTCYIRMTNDFNGCRHSVPHEHSTIEYQSCVDVEGSACYCSCIKKERKQKLKNINHEM